MPAEQKPSYSPGLEGVIAGETAICHVDPNAGLLYRGYDIHDLAQSTPFEDVAYLLLNGELPTPDQSAQFRQQITAASQLPAPLLETLKLIPKDAAAMDVLRTGISMLAAFDPDLADNSHDANLRKSIRLIAAAAT